MKTILNNLVLNGGFTVDSKLQVADVNAGYMVGGFSKEYKIKSKDLNIKTFTKLIKKLQREALKNDLFIGGWYKCDNNIYYIELSKHINLEFEALRLGRKFKQLAIYDLKNNKSIYIK